MVEHITPKFLDLIQFPSPQGKKLNYLMVMPKIATNDHIMYVMPYGFCLVVSALKASGRNVFTLNLNYKQDWENLLRSAILEHSIDVVATGGLSGQFAQMKAILDVAKAVKPNIITMIGGGIVTSDPTVAMKAFGNADYGMIGEGEITINALAYAIENDEDVHRVAGLVLPDGTITAPRAEIDDLDIIPFPDYEGLELDELLQDCREAVSWYEKNPVGITLSRSCPYQCTFCFHSSGKRYRKRSLENVFSEIDWIVKNWAPDGKELYFIVNDELFISDMEYLRNFCRRIKEYPNIRYWVQTRVDTITKDVLLMLKESGCTVVSYGVESADNRILKSMRKNITVARIERAFDLALEVGIPAYGNIIFGDLEENLDSIQNSLNWWKRHPQYHIFLLHILTFPGTHLYKVACERGIIQDPVQYLIRNDTQINVTKMPDALYWQTARRIELFQLLTLSGIDVEFSEIEEREEILRAALEQLLDGQPIAIWPAIFSTIDVLNEVSPRFVESPNVYLVNSNPNDTRLQGIEKFGKPIFQPTILLEKNVRKVLFAYTQPGSTQRVLERISKMIAKYYPDAKDIIQIADLLK